MTDGAVTAQASTIGNGASPGPAELSAATVHEAAGRIGALPMVIHAMAPSFRVCGPAFPVRCRAGDNLALHEALYQASAKDVLVVDVGAGTEFGYWGEILSEAAKARGLGGLVINGGVRDSDALARVGFPVFAAGLCIQGTGKCPPDHGEVGMPVRIGDVHVRAGDLVVGDSDGVVVIAAADVAQTLRAAAERDRKEEDVIARLRAGESTLDIYGLH